MIAIARVVVASTVLAALTACGGAPINAGKTGGRAFILFTIMLLAMVGALWASIGRGD